MAQENQPNRNDKNQGNHNPGQERGFGKEQKEQGESTDKSRKASSDRSGNMDRSSGSNWQPNQKPEIGRKNVDVEEDLNDREE